MTNNAINIMPNWHHNWRNYWVLCKPKVVFLILVTAIVGMVMAVETWQWSTGITMIWATIGIGLAASSAAVVNHILDQRIDAKMRRTEQRPLPQGNVSEQQAAILAALLALLSVIVLWTQTNVLTTVLTLLTLVGYAFVYTGYLKHATPQNIVIGGITGAAPPALGWVAITGELHAHALLLVLIIFVWTPPHFWALAIARHDDYANAKVPMLPVTHGIHFTKWQIIFYTVLLVVVSVMPFVIGMSGLPYLMVALFLGAGYLYQVVRLLPDQENKTAMPAFGYSIWYLFILFIALTVDHLIAMPL
ncbi:MAG: protoheme IX farnesyltransferase [Gammaproteobacteria bacterium]|nr:protoheme IX farnesyltransferase [Gammaproteobacteria bacterium]